MLDEIERAGFYCTTGNTVWWGSRERRVETFEPSGDASGFQVFRPALDRLLRDSAARARVRLLEIVRETLRNVTSPSLTQSIQSDTLAAVQIEEGLP